MRAELRQMEVNLEAIINGMNALADDLKFARKTLNILTKELKDLRRRKVPVSTVSLLYTESVF